MAPPRRYLEALQDFGDLTHAYPFNESPEDLAGTAHGVLKGSGTTFGSDGASFTGKGYVQLPDRPEFTITPAGLTIACWLTIRDWKGSDPSDGYVHWMGKGNPQDEWVFRHYVTSGDPDRQGRISVYAFNPGGGLGAGSYYQRKEDPIHPTYRQFIVGVLDFENTTMFVDGVKRDQDPLDEYDIHPTDTPSAPCVGSRGDGTGYLIGSIEALSFSSRALTADQIAELYAIGPEPVDGPPIDPDPGEPGDFTATSDLLAKHNALAAHVTSLETRLRAGGL